jgi:hypothetical protein
MRETERKLLPVQLTYDEIETTLIALVLRQEEIMSIPFDERTDTTLYELDHIFEVSEHLNNVQRRYEELGVSEIEQVISQIDRVQRPKKNWLSRLLKQ